MGILSWVIMGVLAGALAKWIMPGKDGGGFFITMLLGIAGAFVGGFAGNLLGFGGVSGFDIRTLVLATIGALGLLWLRKSLSK